MTQTPPQQPQPPQQPASPYMPPQSAGPVAAQAVAEAPPSSMGGWALALGILGLLGCIPLGLVAIILGIVALGKPAASRGKATAGIITGAASLVVVPLLIAILLPSLARARELAQMSLCAANMNAVGKGMQMYMIEHDDAPPQNLDALIEMGAIQRPHLECPSAKDGTPWPHYFYLAPSADAPGSTFVLCDLKGNHPRDGRNVLTLGSSVRKFRTEAQFQAALTRPENTAFAAALRKAEAGLPTAAPRRSRR